MNYSLAVFLVNPTARCVSVAYDKTTDRAGKTIPQDVKSFKTLDADIKKGDYVVIPTDTRWGFTVGRVEEVDLRVNFNSQEQMRWVVSRVDKQGYEDWCKQEDTLVNRVADAEEQDQRAKLREKLLAFNPNLDALSIVDQSSLNQSLPAERTGNVEPPQRGGAQAEVREAPSAEPDPNF